MGIFDHSIDTSRRLSPMLSCLTIPTGTRTPAGLPSSAQAPSDARDFCRDRPSPALRRRCGHRFLSPGCERAQMREEPLVANLKASLTRQECPYLEYFGDDKVSVGYGHGTLGSRGRLPVATPETKSFVNNGEGVVCGTLVFIKGETPESPIHCSVATTPNGIGLFIYGTLFS